MTEIQKQAQSNKLSIAVAIIVAGIIIAGAMYFSGRGIMLPQHRKQKYRLRRPKGLKT